MAFSGRVGLGVMRGVRAWSPADAEGTLRGMFSPHAWERGVNTATCQAVQPCGDVLGEQCRCGFYAYWRPVNAGHRVLGVIEGWGRVQYAELGFRCEKARIVALAAGGHGGDLMDELASRHMARTAAEYYQVPLFPTVGDILAEYPTTPPDDIEPVPPGRSGLRLTGLALGGPAVRARRGGILFANTAIQRAGRSIPPGPAAVGNISSTGNSTGPHLHIEAAEDMRALSVAIRELGRAVSTSALQVRDALVKVQRLLRDAGLVADPGPTDPKERALWLTKNRHTGPAKAPHRNAASRLRKL